MFFMYGLTNRPSLAVRNTIHKELSSVTLTHKIRLPEFTKTESGRYRPPHLSKREGTSSNPSKSWDSRTFSDHETSILGFTSSDSEHSDSDGSGKDMDYFQSSKARIAAIICVQDICQAEPKPLTSHWTMLLPTSDVLHPRMPGDLLPSVVSCVQTRMMKGFQSRTDQNGLMVTGLGCLGAAFSTSPPSPQLKDILQEGISA
ncbi:hypothetical protein MKX01_011511, partial [Papaver californicum]